MSFLTNIFAKKSEPIESYEDFWRWFQKHEKRFFKAVQEHRNIEKDFFDKLSPKLQELQEGFFFLAGMADSTTAELVITADGTIKNIVFVEELVMAAPKIDGWLFTALKPALDIKDVSIEMAGYTFNEENLSFYSNDHAEYPDEIDITLVHHELDKENKSTITNGTYIFLDNFLGELNFATTIDSLTVIGKAEAKKELVPIGKLKDFLIWRQKEFIEKYSGLRYSTENDHFSGFEARMKSGNMLVATINKGLLSWDCKASHPWILSIELKYDGESSHGMPDDETYQLLDEIEDKISLELPDYEGYLNIGRQTADSVREIYVACSDFRKPSKVLHQIQHSYANQLDIHFDIYKDKYWQSFNRFDPSYC